jgi:hypothetical protein
LGAACCCAGLAGVAVGGSLGNASLHAAAARAAQARRHPQASVASMPHKTKASYAD